MSQVAGLAAQGTPVPPSVAYLNNSFKDKPSVDILTDIGLAELFKNVAFGVVSNAVTALNKENNWNNCSIMLVEAAKAHSRCFVMSEFSQGVANSRVSDRLRHILSNLFQLMAVTWILQEPSKFLRFANLEFSHIDQLVQRRNHLLSAIRPLAIPLVDSFDFRDEVLRSTLGCWDGWVYHRLFQAAAKTPLNTAKEIPEGLREQLRKKNRSKL